MDLPSIGIAIIVSSVAVGALFAGIDAALLKLGDVHLSALRDSEGTHSLLAARVLKDFDAIRARLLAGRAICLASATALAWESAAEVGPLWVSIAATAGVALLYSIAAEAVGAFAMQRNGTWALVVLKWLRPLEILLTPLAWPLLGVRKWVTSWVPEVEPVHTEETERIATLAVEKVIDEGEESGSIDEAHAELLRSVLEFKDTVAREVMVPRTRMISYEIATPLREILASIVAEGHSRYPVYRDRVDHMEGVLYAKDLFRLVEKGGGVDKVRLEDLLRRPVLFVAESQKISSVLRSMQSRRHHMAVVVDEFGGTSGVVTLEDVLEEIVGEIEDEHDEAEPRMKQVAPMKYVVDASVSVYDFEEFMGYKLPGEGGDFDSIGGFLVNLAGRVPAVGEELDAGELRFTVRESDEKRVRKIEIQRGHNTPRQTTDQYST